MSQKGYDNSETAVRKLSARKIWICRVYFSVIIFDLLFFLTSETLPQQKQTRQIWIRLVEYSSAEVSDPSEVPRFVGKLFF